MYTGDLSVLDVQKILREHEDLGHDITSDPHVSYVEGKPYRMRAYGSVHIINTTDYNNKVIHLGHHVSSLLTQSERPLVSSVSSSISHDSESAIRSRYYLPHQYVKDGEPTSHYYAFGPKFSETKHAPKMLYGGEHSNTSSIHEALQNQATSPLKHQGSYGIYNPSRHMYDTTDVTHINEFPHPFDHKAALLEMGTPRNGHPPFEPYSGLIHVVQTNLQSPHDSVYLYHPESEKLLKVEHP